MSTLYLILFNFSPFPVTSLHFHSISLYFPLFLLHFPLLPPLYPFPSHPCSVNSLLPHFFSLPTGSIILAPQENLDKQWCILEKYFRFRICLQDGRLLLHDQRSISPLEFGVSGHGLNIEKIMKKITRSFLDFGFLVCWISSGFLQLLENGTQLAWLSSQRWWSFFGKFFEYSNHQKTFDKQFLSDSMHDEWQWQPRS